MAWSFRVGRLGGSEIRIHATFLMLVAWLAAAHYQQGGIHAAVQGVAFVLVLFACVVAHEFGHAFAARRYGIGTPSITLLPIGGLARLERMPEKAGQEIVVALAGPAVNAIIAVLAFLFTGTGVGFDALQRLDDPGLGYLEQLASVIFLAMFNLLPAFPMDGGRVLRAVLSLWYSRTTATNVAARIGQALAVVFGFVGLVSLDPMLILIAFFVYSAAQRAKRPARKTRKAT